MMMMMVMMMDIRELLLNAMDRSMRLMAWIKDEEVEGQEGEGMAHRLELRYRFQEHVDRQQWNQCGLTPDGEYVFGGKEGREGEGRRKNAKGMG